MCVACVIKRAMTGEDALTNKLYTPTASHLYSSQQSITWLPPFIFYLLTYLPLYMFTYSLHVSLYMLFNSQQYSITLWFTSAVDFALLAMCVSACVVCM